MKVYIVIHWMIKQIKKLNDETSYDITIDGKYIYYLAKMMNNML